LDFPPVCGTESDIVDCEANLQQEIGATSRPAHPLRIFHSALHQEIGGAFGDCGSHTQAATMEVGVKDQAVALATAMTVQRLQRGPQPFGRRFGSWLWQ
jgi:hypothetical protein